MNIVIFGPPGAGKGTQSKFLVQKINLNQLSTGDLLRKEIKNNTDLGKKISSIINSGELVSDKIVSDLIEKFISKDTYKDKIIFDGYPRNLVQAENLDKLAPALVGGAAALKSAIGGDQTGGTITFGGGQGIQGEGQIGFGADKNFITTDSIIPNVPNYIVLAGAGLGAYLLLKK